MTMSFPARGKVLKAAALTYVAALLMSALQLLRYVLIFMGRNNRGQEATTDGRPGNGPAGPDVLPE